LEGRQLLSAGSGHGVRPGHIENPHLLATAPQQAEINSIANPVRSFGHRPLQAAMRLPNRVTPVITAAVTAPGHKAITTTLTVSSTPNPQAGTLPRGAFQYYYSEYGGGIVTNQLRVDFYGDQTGEIQYALQSTDTGTTDYWVWLGRWTVHGSTLEFVGRGTRTRSSRIPSWNLHYSFNADLKFSFFQLVQGGMTLDLTLADEFGKILGPNGPTRNIALSKIGQH
jgi:hypothetical protein